MVEVYCGWRNYLKGVAVQALGALILMAFEIVGAMLTADTGTLVRSALVPAPQIMMGNTAEACCVVKSCLVFSFTRFHPGNVSIIRSPQVLLLKELRIGASMSELAVINWRLE